MAETREFSSSMSAPQSGNANLNITVNGATTNYNPFGPDRNVNVEGGNANLNITVNGATTNYKPGGPDKTLNITIPTDTVRYDTAQTLTDAQKALARSNIGVTPTETYVPGMATNTASWTNKAYGESWKYIQNPGATQLLDIVAGKPIIIRTWIRIKTAGLSVSQSISFRLYDGVHEIDRQFIDFEPTAEYRLIPLIFMAGNPDGGTYQLQASANNAIAENAYVYVAGYSTGSVKALSIL